MDILLRRRGLGKGSCQRMVNQSSTGLQVVRNDIIQGPYQKVFRWGCTSTVNCESVYNQSPYIHLVNDKTGFRRACQSNDVLVPKSYFSLEELGNATYPLIIRPKHHAQGRYLFLATGRSQAFRFFTQVGGDGYASEVIQKVAEYRVCFAFGRVAWVAQKYPANPNDIAWNVAQGGRFENVRWGEWPIAVIKEAYKAYLLSQLDYGGVDVMVDADGKPYILEINSAPSQTSPYRIQSLVKTFDYVINNGGNHIIIDVSKSNWRYYAHPALSEEVYLNG